MKTKKPSSIQPGDRWLVNTFHVLTAYPLFWTVCILLSGLLTSKVLLWIAMCTWVVALFIGMPGWVTLAVILTATGKMRPLPVLLNFVIASAGTLAAYFVAEYDVFGSGVKYVD